VHHGFWRRLGGLDVGAVEPAATRRRHRGAEAAGHLPRWEAGNEEKGNMATHGDYSGS